MEKFFEVIEEGSDYSSFAASGQHNLEEVKPKASLRGEYKIIYNRI
jgi:hypothetical protein